MGCVCEKGQTMDNTDVEFFKNSNVDYSNSAFQSIFLVPNNEIKDPINHNNDKESLDNLDKVDNGKSKQQLKINKNEMHLEEEKIDLEDKIKIIIPPTDYKITGFGKKLLNELNEARSNPRGYAEKINSYIQYIKKGKRGENILHIHGVAKISLLRGEIAFKEAIDHMNSINKCVPSLQWCDDIMIEIPRDVTELNKDILQQLILKSRSQLKDIYPNIHITLDVVDDPVISALLQIVDDSAFQGHRRNTILSDKYNLFAVSQGYDRKNKEFSLLSFS